MSEVPEYPNVTPIEKGLEIKARKESEADMNDHRVFVLPGFLLGAKKIFDTLTPRGKKVAAAAAALSVLGAGFVGAEAMSFADRAMHPDVPSSPICLDPVEEGSSYGSGYAWNKTEQRLEELTAVAAQQGVQIEGGVTDNDVANLLHETTVGNVDLARAGQVQNQIGRVCIVSTSTGPNFDSNHAHARG